MSLSQGDAASLTDLIDTLQTSARRTLPMFLIGIAATLLAAGIALYYILTLSGDLKIARAELRRTEMALAVARQSLAVANASLRETQVAVTSSSADAGDARRIQAAISDVSRSERQLNVASAAIQQAAARLPTPTAAEQRTAAAADTGWFAVIGSYAIDQTGLARAMEQMRRVEKQGFCAELWQTRISGNYAVVLGARSDRGRASENAILARKADLAADAFAQPDREWSKLPQSPSC